MRRRISTTLAARLAAAAMGVAGLIAATTLLSGESAERASAQGSLPQPNLIVITTDDQRLTLDKEVMPRTVKKLVKKGTRFPQAIVTTPLCCPSRASLITGQYAHNHGALSNRAGYPSLVDKENVLPEWLRQAGYRTTHLGKYLNGYPGGGIPKETVAPGWDEWATLMNDRQYYDYELSINGTPKAYGKKDTDHLTRVLNRKAVKTIRRDAPSESPFFLQLDHFAPHIEVETSRNVRCGGNATPDRRDEKLFKDEPLARPISFNESDVSDKPSFVQALPSLSRKRRNAVRKRNRCRLASLAGVDRGVNKIIKTLKEVGELDRTAIVFMSDNGYFLGEHRIKVNKTLPYDEALRVPLALRIPKAYRGGGERLKKSSKRVANIDVVPTLLELAGADPCRAPGDCRTMDGRSLLGELSGQDSLPGNRPLLIEYGRSIEEDNIFGVCGYSGLRLKQDTYIEYTSLQSEETGQCVPSGERELYDLSSDPFQASNLYPPAPGTPTDGKVAQLEALLSGLADCSGIEGRDPDPPGRRTFCE